VPGVARVLTKRVQIGIELLHGVVVDAAGLCLPDGLGYINFFEDYRARSGFPF
jgi:hypothetical protein